MSGQNVENVKPNLKPHTVRGGGGYIKRIVSSEMGVSNDIS